MVFGARKLKYWVLGPSGSYRDPTHNLRNLPQSRAFGRFREVRESNSMKPIPACRYLAVHLFICVAYMCIRLSTDVYFIPATQAALTIRLIV